MADPIYPKNLKVGDRVHLDQAVYEVVKMGLTQDWAPGEEYVEIECTDPLGTGLAVGFKKTLKRTFRGVWWRAS